MSKWLVSGRGVFAALAFALGTAALAGAQVRGAPLSAWDKAALERARAGAAKRLQSAECLRLLTDFTDPAGHTLQANLEPFGLSASEYIERVVFLDGSAARNCRLRSVQLTTPPGLPTVFVCPAGASALGSRFAQTQARDPTLAEHMLIHEMLHTLGLGENPPSSLEITDRVRDRCQ